MGYHLRQYDFHVVEVTKPIVSVSYLCENGIETHLARQPFLRNGERDEPFDHDKRCARRQGADRSRS